MFNFKFLNAFLVFFGSLIFTNLFADIHRIDFPSNLPNDPAELYIDLIKRTVANTIYQDPNFTLERRSEYQQDSRNEGRDWPTVAHTMIGIKRLDNIHYCLKEIIRNRVPGDCIETGVWRGGATILMRAILKAYNQTQRYVWVADSFEGLPPPNTAKYPADHGMDLFKYKHLAISLEKVKKNFEKYGLLDNQVIFLKGFFSQTLPNAPIGPIALLRLDGDLYESTMDSLINLYPKVSQGGYVIIDDYFIPACANAVNEYREKHGITAPLISIDWASVYWKK